MTFSATLCKPWANLATFIGSVVLGPSIVESEPGRCIVRCSCIFPSAPIRWLPLDERTDRAQVTLVTQEIRLLRPFAPEFDGEGQCVDRLLVAPDEGAAEVDPLEVVLFRLQVRDLADIIADGVQQAPRDVLGLEHAAVADEAATAGRPIVHAVEGGPGGPELGGGAHVLMAPAVAVLGPALGLALALQHLAETTRDRLFTQADLLVAHALAVDVADEQVDGAVVALVGHA